MRAIILTILFSLNFTFAICQSNEVRTVFDNYKSAMIKGSGQDAIKFVTTKTIDFYDKLLYHTIHADSIDFSKFSLIEKSFILILRHTTKLATLDKLNGKSLFIYAIENGLVDKQGVANGQLGDIVVNDNVAKGQFISGGKKTSFYFEFIKEKNVWKFNLISLFDVSNIAFKQLLKQKNMTEVVAFNNILTLINGKLPDKNIWKPLKK